MKILVACKYSGIVRDAFIKQGHDAWSCDIIQTESPGPHLFGDVSLYLDMGWDMMIAHPPCTYLCNSGVRHLYTKNGKNHPRWKLMYEACKFFNKLLRCEIPKICIENPIPHKHSSNQIGKYDQIIQPWQFGHDETKATCLWLKNLPKLQPTNIVAGRVSRIHKLPPSKDRGKIRSKTYTGIADAMASQWS